MNKTTNLYHEKKKHLSGIYKYIFVFIVMLFIPIENAAAKEDPIYKDGIYLYQITDDVKREVRLIGVEPTKAMSELDIPGTAKINDQQYRVSSFSIHYDYYGKEEYQRLYQSITKLNFADTFTGTITEATYAFPNLTTFEFYGTEPPKQVIESISNGEKRSDLLFIVPSKTEDVYANAITIGMSYYLYSDLYEFEIPMKPTIVSKGTDLAHVEYGIFSVDDYLYQVTASGKAGKGTVQLIGQKKTHDNTYLKLPSEVKNNGYTYSLTKLCLFSLIGSGARVVVVPDTVTAMDSSVFDHKVELLFLSKNCKEIPRMITDENNESNLRFVHVPEGVTTIAERSYPYVMEHEASIILPTTIKTVGKNSLSDYKLVTFLNKKPIKNIASAIKEGTTVKVNKSSIKAYQAVLGKKAKVIAAKDVIKATKLTVTTTSLTLNTSQIKNLKGTLTKDSNETIFWLSSNPDIFEISDKGDVIPKKAGTAYAIAYTRTSGLHQAIKVTVTDKLITQGIYTYRITNAKDKTATLCQVKPAKTTTKLNIPEKISYDKKTYTVTEVLADPHPLKRNQPLIPDQYENNKIKEIVFPKTITGNIGYLGKLKQIKSITFKGNKAPSEIHWYADYGKLAFQAVIYVPKNCVDTYTSALRICITNEIYSYMKYGCRMDFNVVETGSDQLQRFVVDGILYKVTKKAGTKSGEVAIKGADLGMEKIKLGNTVKYGKYTYKITQVYKDAFADRPTSNIQLGDSIKKVGTTETYKLPMYLIIGMPES